ncbi:MAG: hypothetical protein BJ554DRAFT_4503, partial [Olpidium bornovanus]
MLLFRPSRVRFRQAPQERAVHPAGGTMPEKLHFTRATTPRISFSFTTFACDPRIIISDKNRKSSANARSCYVSKVCNLCWWPTSRRLHRKSEPLHSVDGKSISAPLPCPTEHVALGPAQHSLGLETTICHRARLKVTLALPPRQRGEKYAEIGAAAGADAKKTGITCFNCGKIGRIAAQILSEQPSGVLGPKRRRLAGLSHLWQPSFPFAT